MKPELPTEPSHVDAGDVELQPESQIPSENTEDVPTVGETTGEGETKGEVEGEDEEGGGALGGGGSAAYNPETGEINWDCPCLGGMAHGPCGLQFREAFSCFVFSEDEPKGINCVTKFKAMQDCFREHPDVYGEGSSNIHTLSFILLTLCSPEIMNDEEDDLELPPSDSESPLTEAPPSEFVTETPSSPPQESLKVQEGS